MSISSFPAGTTAAAAAAGGAGPSVSITANGQSATQIFATYTGQQFNSNGSEYECATASGAFTQNQTTWLDSGSAGDVWVEFTRTAGDTNFSGLDPGSGRHQCSTTRSWRHNRTTPGIDTINGYFRMYDAASGGNTLDTGPTSLWFAEYEFDPCPICCFTADTMITMANGSKMRIGDIRQGDKILTLTDDLLDVAETEVTEVIVRVNRPMYRIHFTNGSWLDASVDHPLYIKGLGWASVGPDERIEYKDIGVPKKLEVGGEVHTEFAQVFYITKIEPLEHPDAVFTFAESRFFANGILVY